MVDQGCSVERRRSEEIDVPDGSNANAVAFPSGKYASLSLTQKLLVLTFVGVGVWYLAWRPGT